ncbi:hypothetical protein Nepgr_003121 [Nepenthes gracilis]|uniref:Uncharacterized protein n=1 Tax=Nepenthes gracilis TaxID=150966 RepID=A0AAD3RYY2_NEPGR|nr:hypothetical protein Nepgr_003121 [Nepenthes gracilis]
MGGDEYRKGLWTEEEDRILMDYVKNHGKGKWNRISKFTALKRCGKSCRLRWMNYLSPAVKRGDFSEEEDDLIIRLHNLLGNRWSLIAGRVPGRTDNQVKNHWNTHLSKKLGIKKGKIKVDDYEGCGELQKQAAYGCASSKLWGPSPPQEPLDEDYYGSSFLFCNDYELNLDVDAPSLMGFPNNCSLNFAQYSS